MAIFQFQKKIIIFFLFFLLFFYNLKADIIQPRFSKSDLGWIEYYVINHPWQNKKSNLRIPVVVDNREGPSQILYPVEIPIKSSEIKNLSVEVIDEGGNIIPSYLEKDRIIFIPSIPKETWRFYYVYFLEKKEVFSEKALLSEEGGNWIINNGKILVKIPKRGDFIQLMDYFGTKDVNFLTPHGWHRTLSCPIYAGFYTGNILENNPLHLKLEYKETDFEDNKISDNNLFIETYKELPYLIIEGKNLNFTLSFDDGEIPLLNYLTTSGEKEEKLNFYATGYGEKGQREIKISGLSGNYLSFFSGKGRISFIFEPTQVDINLFESTSRVVLSFNSKTNSPIELLTLINEDPYLFSGRVFDDVSVYTFNLQKKENLGEEKLYQVDKDFPIGTWPGLSFSNIEQQLHEMKILGCNIIMVSLGNPASVIIAKKGKLKEYVRDNLKPMVEKAHSFNIGVIYCIDLPSLKWEELGDFCWSSNEWRKSYITPLIEGAIEAGVDGITIGDEICVGLTPSSKKKFEEKIKQILPDKVDFKNDLSNPVVFELLKFKTGLLTEYTKFCKELVEKYNLKLPAYINFMPTQIPGGDYSIYVDFDGIAKNGIKLMIDPYYASPKERRYCIRFQKGSMDNKGEPTWIGDAINFEPEAMYSQALFNTLYGCKGLYIFSITTIRMKPNANFEACRDFLLQIKSTLGELIMASEPIKYTGIYWNKEGFWEYLKEPNFQYDNEIKNISNLSISQWDFIFPKDIEEIFQYKVLIIPSDKFLNEDDIKKFLDFTKNGGILILYGQNINKYPSLMSALSFSNLTEKKGGIFELDEFKFPLGKVYIPDFKDNLEVLVKDKNNEPLIIASSYGKGKILYFGFNLGESFSSLNFQKVFQKIIKKYASPLVECDDMIEPVLFSGKDFYLLGIYNPDNKEEFEIKINSLTGNFRVFDVLNCKEIEVLEQNPLKIKINLSPGKIGFYQILLSPTKLPDIAPEIFKRSILSKVEKSPDKKGLFSESCVKEKSGFSIALLKTGIEADGIANFLKEKGYSYYFLEPQELNIDTIPSFDLLIFPGNIPNISLAPRNWQNSVREYVKRGGNIILTHDAVGGRVFPYRLFPEVATGKEMLGYLEKGEFSNVFVADEKTPLTKNLIPGKEYKHPYWDHFTLSVGPLGKVILKDKENNPVFVTGEFGKGFVAISGFLFGYDKFENNKEGTCPPKGWVADFLVECLEMCKNRRTK